MDLFNTWQKFIESVIRVSDLIGPLFVGAYRSSLVGHKIAGRASAEAFFPCLMCIFIQCTLEVAVNETFRLRHVVTYSFEVG